MFLLLEVLWRHWVLVIQVARLKIRNSDLFGRHRPKRTALILLLSYHCLAPETKATNFELLQLDLFLNHLPTVILPELGVPGPQGDPRIQALSLYFPWASSLTHLPMHCCSGPTSKGPRICPSSRSLWPRCGRTLCGHDRANSPACRKLSWSSAISIRRQRSRRTVAMEIWGAHSVCDWMCADAPGSYGFGGDMMRRRRSCSASAVQYSGVSILFYLCCVKVRVERTLV